jgi:hypothetical protein
VCAIESARSAHPRCHGASVGFGKGRYAAHGDTYEAAGVYWRISRPSAVE